MNLHTEKRTMGAAQLIRAGERVTIVRCRPRSALGATLYIHAYAPSIVIPSPQEESPETNRLLLTLTRATGPAWDSDAIDMPVRGYRVHVDCEEAEIIAEVPATATCSYLVSGGYYDGAAPQPAVQLIDFTYADFLVARAVKLLEYSTEWRAWGEGGLLFLPPPSGTFTEYIPAVSAYGDWTPIHRRAQRCTYVPGGSAQYCRIEVR